MPVVASAAAVVVRSAGVAAGAAGCSPAGPDVQRVGRDVCLRGGGACPVGALDLASAARHRHADCYSSSVDTANRVNRSNGPVSSWKRFLALRFGYPSRAGIHPTGEVPVFV